MAEQITVSEPLVPVEQNIIFGNAPLFTSWARRAASPLFCRGTLLLQPKVNVDATFESIERFKATTMIGVPTLYRMMLEHVRVDHYDLSSCLLVQCGRRFARRSGEALAGEVRQNDLSRIWGYGKPAVVLPCALSQ